jgi:peptidyl-prolyl cis-trans isomerase B (cyclophilin B)
VIAFGITGFVVPGFFLAKSGSSASGPDSAAQALADALNKRDTAALNALRCADADPIVGVLIGAVDQVKTAKLTGGAKKVSETEYTANLDVISGNEMDATRFTGTFSSANAKWCWKNMTGSTDQPSAGSAPTLESAGSPESTSAAGAQIQIPTRRPPMPRRPTPLANPVTCEYPADSQSPAAKPVNPPPAGQIPSNGTVAVTLKSTAGDLKLTLDRALAPCMVNSFLSLAKQGFYTGTACHRLGTDGLQMLQCGDPRGDGTGGPGYTIADENFPELTYGRGILAMAKTSEPNSSGSQFFMVYGEARLYPDYAVFGSISDEGLRVLDKVARGGIDPASAQQIGDGTGRPKIPVTFTAVIIDG